MTKVFGVLCSNGFCKFDSYTTTKNIEIMNDITGIVVKNILQEKLNKYTMYYNKSYQYGDYDMSDYYKSRIKELNVKLSKLITKYKC